MPQLLNNSFVDTGDELARRRRAPGHDRIIQLPVRQRHARLRAASRLQALEARLHRWLVAYSITLLRLSVGAIFLGFGALKFFPGVSPAEDLVIATTSSLTLGLVPGSIALVAVAIMECVIGVWLISGLALRGAMYLLAIQLVGILSPVVLLVDRLFSGPHNAPTLEGQYVLKDVIIVGAALVLAAISTGGRLTSETAEPPSVVGDVGRAVVDRPGGLAAVEDGEFQRAA